MYSSTAFAECNLCNMKFSATCENITASEANLDAVTDLQKRLDAHFFTLEHLKKKKIKIALDEAEFKEYNINIVGYING